MISGKLFGFKALRKKLDAVVAEANEGQVMAVKEATLLIHETAVKSIADIHGGKTAIRYNPKRAVAVSNPGDPPNSDRGRLIVSIKFDFQRQGLVGRVGSNLSYAKDLEFGTERMEARPWLAPAVEEVNKDIADIFKRNVDEAIKKAVNISAGEE